MVIDMGYEVDFIGVGEESKSGDAIALRYGDLHGSREDQTVIVIDGGFTNTGDKIVEHVRSHFGTVDVDIVVSTHPDQDHINGLITVLNNLNVKELWMHLPWDHNQGLAGKFNDGRITDNSIGEQLKNNLEKAYDLYKLAVEKGVLIREPFTGTANDYGHYKVLGPSQSYYEDLIPHFDGMPEVKTEDKSNQSLFDRVIQAAKRFFATWGEDQIDDDGETSARNSSSVITQLIVDGRRLIFTGDAGIEALHLAADEYECCPDPAEISMFQIPHHGSRRNIGPAVLNRFIGYPVNIGEVRNITAIASTAANGEPKHPRKSVMNAFTHRGVKTLATRGKGICHFHDAPQRDGWSSLNPEPYHYEYEESA